MKRNCQRVGWPDLPVIVSLLIGCTLGFFAGESVSIRRHFSIENKSGIAFNEMRAIRAAISRFRAAYGAWPCTSNGSPDQAFCGEKQSEVTRMLTGADRSI